jgi:putative phosphoesterase
VSVACLYDIHGNLPALEAVLGERDVQAADVVLIGGDVLPGPLAAAVLDRLEALGDRAVFVRGNGDRDPDAWARETVDGDRLETAAAWPERVELDVEGLGAVLFCHCSPRSDEEIITVASPPERVRPMLADVAGPVVVCGHTHVQFDRRVDGTRLINAGSVGMPYEGAPGHAFWCMLGPGAELRRTPFDTAAAAAAIRASGMPGAEEWAAEYVLAQHSAEEATRVFEEMATNGE